MFQNFDLRGEFQWGRLERFYHAMVPTAECSRKALPWEEEGWPPFRPWRSREGRTEAGQRVDSPESVVAPVQTRRDHQRESELAPVEQE